MSDIIGFLGSILGMGQGQAQAQAQQMENMSNTQQTVMNNKTMMDIANMNNQTSIDLSNTAVQRRYKDLEAAGINPLMAGGIGGAQTPTLQMAQTQAPQVRGMAQAARAASPAQALEAGIRTQQTAMNIEKTKAETDLVQAEKDKAIADALAVKEGARKTGVEADWLPKMNQQRMDLEQSQQHLNEAQKQTTEALRDPTVNKILAETNLQKQILLKAKAETTTAEAFAKNAAELYGADANKAKLIVDQMATYYKNYFLPSEEKKLTKLDLENALLTSENTKKMIENIIANDYGRMQAWSKIFSTVTSAGAVLGGPKDKVLKEPPNKR